MKVEKARELLDNQTFELPPKNSVMLGLQILAKYEEDVVPSFEHDVIYASTFEDTVKNMTKEDVLQMGLCGWTEDDFSECWIHG